MKLRFSGAGLTMKGGTEHTDIMRETSKRSWNENFIEGAPFGGNNFELTETEAAEAKQRALKTQKRLKK